MVCRKRGRLFFNFVTGRGGAAATRAAAARATVRPRRDGIPRAFCERGLKIRVSDDRELEPCAVYVGVPEHVSIVTKSERLFFANSRFEALEFEERNANRSRRRGQARPRVLAARHARRLPPAQARPTQRRTPSPPKKKHVENKASSLFSKKKTACCGFTRGKEQTQIRVVFLKKTQLRHA